MEQNESVGRIKTADRIKTVGRIKTTGRNKLADRTIPEKPKIGRESSHGGNR